MARIVFGIIAVIASFVLADSLTCNKCSVGVFGFCLNSGSVSCSNTSSCYTGKASFPSITGFNGFNTQGCLADNSSCAATTNGTILGATYTVQISCCNADKCNPVVISSAPSSKLSLGVALAAVAMASVWGSA